MLGGIIMANLNELELQNLRHLIGAHSTIEKNLNVIQNNVLIQH